jgi:hypothetical protein
VGRGVRWGSGQGLGGDEGEGTGREVVESEEIIEVVGVERNVEDAIGANGEEDRIGALIGCEGEKLVGLDFGDHVSEKFLSRPWSADMVRCLAAAVHLAYAQDRWNLVYIIFSCEDWGVFEGVDAWALRKWRELLWGGYKPAVFLETRCKRHFKDRAEESTLVAEGVNMCHHLDDQITLMHAVKALSDLIDEDGGMEARERKKRSVPVWGEAWARIGSDKGKLRALLDVAVATNVSESGFLSMTDASELIANALSDARGLRERVRGKALAAGGSASQVSASGQRGSPEKCGRNHVMRKAPTRARVHPPVCGFG